LKLSQYIYSLCETSTAKEKCYQIAKALYLIHRMLHEAKDLLMKVMAEI
jgi:hypothetical protein